MRICRRSTVGALAGLALAGMASIGGSSAQTADMPTVRVGGAPSLMYLPFYVAIEQGFFAKQGLKIDSINMASTIAPLVNGDIDLALNGSDSAIISAARGRPTPAVVMMQQRNSMSLTASPGLEKTNSGKPYPEKLTDLRGKTIAIIGRGSGAEVFVKQMMNGAGMLEGRDYNIVVISSPAGIITSLKTGQVAAANLWSPFQEQAWLEGAGTALVKEVEEGPAGRRLAVGISIHANPDFLKNKKELAQKFVAAMVEADAFTRDISKNKEALLDIAEKYTVKNREALALALPTIASLAYPGIDCEAWRQSAEGLKSVEAVPSVPKCGEMAALDVAPQGPIGPSGK